jgi:uncharacterized NAD-dependent epimerase/dehydratase family protein
MQDKKRHIVILTEGYFGDLEAKTASGLIMYKPEEVVAVIDSTQAGKTSQEILGYGGDIPVVKNVVESLMYSPNTLLIGIAPRGGKLPQEWRETIRQALGNGLDIINGLHDMLNDDPEFSKLAVLKGATIHDLREASKYNTVATGDPTLIKATVVLTVGTDCKSGKKITAIEMAREAKKHGWNPCFVPTGQSGIAMFGEGIPIDSIVGDFMSGAIEEFLIQKSETYDLLCVEGQGTIIHPGYSGVSLALLHGSLPDAMILCHHPGRERIKSYWIKIPPLNEMIKLHQDMARPIKPAKIMGISLNTQGMTEKEAKKEIAKVEKETGLPAIDPVRFGCEKLVNELEPLRK